MQLHYTTARQTTSDLVRVNLWIYMHLFFRLKNCCCNFRSEHELYLLRGWNWVRPHRSLSYKVMMSTNLSLGSMSIAGQYQHWILQKSEC
jgi:hypothetical protein